MKRIPIFTVIVLVVFSSYAQTIVRTEEAKDAAARFAIKENLLNTLSENYTKERDAVARLLADCGTASDMDYCYNNIIAGHGCRSFTYPADARRALVDTFTTGIMIWLGMRPLMHTKMSLPQPRFSIVPQRALSFRKSGTPFHRVSRRSMWRTERLYSSPVSLWSGVQLLLPVLSLVPNARNVTSKSRVHRTISRQGLMKKEMKMI